VIVWLNQKNGRSKLHSVCLSKDFYNLFYCRDFACAAAVGYQTTMKLWSVEPKEPVIIDMTPTPETNHGTKGRGYFEEPDLLL
jgi:hypothetical protein